MGGDITGPVQIVLPIASFLVRIHFNEDLSESSMHLGCACVCACVLAGVCVCVAACWSCFLVVRLGAISSTSPSSTYEMSCEIP